ncbi:YeeE/YedE family protein [Marinobacter confluentis]|uniref:YeeE/YedE family protein n=1 Tax=Marinobacter confluentis TaxID=1697557 RepID=A0A4Z1C5A7_9GAMM|nr:YeeE/YedE family protein [Marinobacter confluentis]TGN41631.1 YeeE/YedE family protein [Marinobacter confluentis]
MIDVAWAQFTPWTALAGGALIGVAAALLLLFNGRIAGISGILGGMLTASPGDMPWRAAFIIGLLVAPLGWLMLSDLPPIEIEAGYPVIIIAGLLVGIGTRYGSGCTSGHGVCGISRFSPRSLVATATFMAAGFVTVYVVKHQLGGF